MTTKEIYKILEYFKIICDNMTDFEKKEFVRNFVESIELYPDRKASERIMKQIDFKFRVYYDGQEGYGFRLLDENTVSEVPGNESGFVELTEEEYRQLELPKEWIA